MARLVCQNYLKRIYSITVHNTIVTRSPTGISKASQRCLSVAAETNQEQWHVWSAVCLERLPVITAEKTQLEKDFQDVLLATEEENSYKSSHELREIEDVRLAELKKQEDYEETEMDVMRITAREDEDIWQAEMENFNATDRITEADRTNDTKSTQRRLDRKLVLLVKQKLGDSSSWVLPQGQWQEGETMRESAERTLTKICGNKVDASFLGNAPCGFYKYKYPAKARDETGVDGAKLFFFKAHIRKGDVQLTDQTEDYQWLTSEEFKDYFKPKYNKEVDKFLLDL